MTDAVTEKREKMIATLALTVGVTAENFLGAVKRRVAKEATNDDLLLFLHTANTYGLDPIATPPQIALFVPKNKEGGVPKPYVTFDGWLRILISHPRYYNHGWKDEIWSGGQRGKGTLDAVTFWIDRFEPKHAKHQPGPCDCERDVFEHTELLSECRIKGDYTPWNQWPTRMLKERAAMQGTRFGFGMYVPSLDEVQYAAESETARADASPATVQASPIAPAASIPGAKRARKKEPDAHVVLPPGGLTPDGQPLAGGPTLVSIPALPAPEVREVVDFTKTADALFPATPGPTDTATLPAFDPTASLAVDKALAQAADGGMFDDIV